MTAVSANLKARRTRISFFRSGAFSLWLAIIVVVIIAGASLAAPLVAPYDPNELNTVLSPPDSQYLLGTDNLGRDLLSYLIWGGRISMVFALGAASVSLAVGVIVGAVPTMFGRAFDQLASRCVELVLMIPQLFLLITAVALLGSSTWLVVLIIGLTMWPANAKIMRSQVLSLRRRPFVEAGRIAGHSQLSVLFRHVIPNGIGPVVANSALQMSTAVLVEAGLDFLGLGDPNHPSWGQALNAGQSYMTSAPWLVVFPGLLLLCLMLSLNRIGEAATDRLDPRGAVR